MWPSRIGQQGIEQLGPREELDSTLLGGRRLLRHARIVRIAGIPGARFVSPEQRHIPDAFDLQERRPHLGRIHAPNPLGSHRDDAAGDRDFGIVDIELALQHCRRVPHDECIVVPHGGSTRRSESQSSDQQAEERQLRSEWHSVAEEGRIDRAHE
jgi:hypothetical protein